MSSGIAAGLINNIALLIALSVIQEISYMFPIRSKTVIKVFQGILIGLTSIAVMTVPFVLSIGIIIDTRSILISVTGLMFGFLPTLIASLIAIIYRFSLGGSAMFIGSAVIIFSAVIGLAWRYCIKFKKIKQKWFYHYLFGILVNIFTVALYSAIPSIYNTVLLYESAAVSSVFFPAATLLLIMLLQLQKDRADAFIRVTHEEEWYKSFFNNRHTVMLLFDAGSGSIIDANPAAVELYGWPSAILNSFNISDIDTSPPEELKSRLKKSVNEELTYYITKHRRESGELIDVEVYGGTLKLNGKTVLYAIVHDITNRLAASKALSESEKRFRLVVEGAPDAIYIQANGKFAFLNQRAVSLFGAKTADELIGTPTIEMYHPDYRHSVLERIKALNIDKMSVPLKEEKIIRMDGSVLDIDINAVPIHFNRLDCGLIFARDISARKAMDVQLREQQRLEAVGTLAAGIAHEINNPINGIMNYAQLILDSENLNPEQVKYTEEIISETERVSSIVRNLLQFSRQEKQSHSYASVYDIVDKTTSLIRTLVKKDQIQLELHIADDLPSIKCQSQQIQQVLMNFLTNARDALNEKHSDYTEKKLIRLTADQFLENKASGLRITVTDLGNGMSDEVLEKIFNPFYSTKEKEKGTGLGLSISFGIIQEHSGRIKVDTKEGSYTSFILELPFDNGWEIS